jgi:hypothetical protein
MKQLCANIITRYRENFGRRKPTHLFASVFIWSAASIGRVKLAMGREAHNPPPAKTMFRVAPAAYKEMRGRIVALLRSRKTWAFIENPGSEAVLSLHFSGNIKEKTIARIVRRLNERQQSSFRSIRVNVTPLARFREENFEKFMLSLSKKSEDVRVYCSETHRRQVSFFKRLMSRHVCSVSTF